MALHKVNETAVNRNLNFLYESILKSDGREKLSEYVKEKKEKLSEYVKEKKEKASQEEHWFSFMLTPSH